MIGRVPFTPDRTVDQDIFIPRGLSPPFIATGSAIP
jgi:hypothetical protein